MDSSLKQNEFWRHLIEEKKMTVVVVDLSDLDAVRLAAVNGDTMIYAASLPKIPICLAALPPERTLCFRKLYGQRN